MIKPVKRNKQQRRIVYLETIIRNYEMDIRNAKELIGVDLVELGFCQGEIYKTAIEVASLYGKEG